MQICQSLLSLNIFKVFWVSCLTYSLFIEWICSVQSRQPWVKKCRNWGRKDFSSWILITMVGPWGEKKLAKEWRMNESKSERDREKGERERGGWESPSNSKIEKSSNNLFLSWFWKRLIWIEWMKNKIVFFFFREKNFWAFIDKQVTTVTVKTKLASRST